MAVSYKGLTIKFGGDTTSLQAALKTVQGESRKTSADLKEINKSLKFNPGNTELLAQKVRTLNKAYEETKERLDAYKQAMQQLEDKKQRGEQLTEEEQRQYDSLERSILQCENQLESYEDQLKDTATELEASKTKLYQLGQQLEDNADKFEAAGKAMETVGTGMVATSGAIATASLAAFNEVDAGMDAVVKATGATGEAAEALGESVKNVATTVAGAGYDWETLGNTVGEVSKRFGFTGQDLDDCSERFAQFATITGTDTVTAVQLVSRAMGDAGIDASEYADVLDSLALASESSGISVDKLAGMLTSYGAPMRALGFDTQSAIAIFSQWELAGVNTETAFSGMKKAISNWSKEGKDARVEFGKTLEEIAACPDIASATTKAIEVFGAKAGPDLADAIQGGRFEYQQFMDILEGSKGTVQSVFEETVDGVDQMAVAQKELEAAGSELGAAFSDVLGPVMHDVADILHDVSDALGDMSPEQKEFIAKAVLMTGAAGGLTLGLGKVFQAAGQIGSGFKTLSGLIPAVKTGWAGLTALLAANPMVLVAAGIAAVVAALALFFTKTELGKKIWGDFTGWISEKWEGVKDFLGGIPEWWGGVCDGWTQKQQAASQAMDNLWNGLKDGAANLKDSITNRWNEVQDSTKEKWNGSKKAIGDAWDNIKANATSRAGEIKANIANFNEGVRSNVSEKWSAIKSDMTSKFESIKSTADEKWSAIKTSVSDKVQGARDTITGCFESAKNTVAETFESIRSAIEDKLSAARDTVGNLIQSIKDKFNFSWSLPHLSLPHPYIIGSFSLNPPSVPTFGIDWYAKGGAIAPNNPRLIGVGDSREREWIEPESKLLSIIQEAIRGVAGGPSSVSVEVNVSATVTGRQSAYELGQDIGRGISSAMKQRGFEYA